MQERGWSELDRDIRTRASEALARAGHNMAARELRNAAPIGDTLSALLLCHLAMRVAGDMRGELQAQARDLLGAVALASYAVHQGNPRKIVEHMSRIERLVTAMAEAGGISHAS